MTEIYDRISNNEPIQALLNISGKDNSITLFCLDTYIADSGSRQFPRDEFLYVSYNDDKLNSLASETANKLDKDNRYNIFGDCAFVLDNPNTELVNLIINTAKGLQ